MKMVKTIKGVVMVECPRGPRCHVPIRECELCIYNMYTYLTTFKVDCIYRGEKV